MKKFAWIIALLAALSLGFFACTEPDGTAYQPAQRAAPATEWRTVFDLQDASNGDVPHGIQELAVGALNMSDAAGAPNPIFPLRRAGNNAEEIVTVAGKKAIKYVTTANWGPGLDLDNSAFAYAAGDTITIKGTATGTAIDLALNKNQGSGQQIVGNRVTSSGDFTIVATLTAADIPTIQTNEQKTIRFEDRAGNTTVVITQILIEGERPSSALGTPQTRLNGSVLSWDTITGATNYIVSASNSVISTQTTTTIDLQYALNGKADGNYSVTVVATGTGIRDSAASTAVSYAFTHYSVTIPVTIGGVAVNAEVKMVGTTVRFEASTAYTNVYRVTAGQSSTSYPVVVIDLSALTVPKKLSDVSSVEFLAEHISGAGANGRQFQVLAAKDATAPTGFKPITRKSADKWVVASGATVATSAEYPDLPVFEALVNDAGFKNEDKLVLFLNPDNPAATVVYEIGPIVIGLSGNAPNEVINTGSPLLDVKLDAPITGTAPKTTITQNDAAGNLAYTGTVIWNPPVGSAFDMFVPYTASITLTPALTYRFPPPPNAVTPATDPGFKVNGDDTGLSEYIESFGKVGFFYTFDRTVNFPEEFAITIQGATGATTEIKYADMRTTFGVNTITPVANGYKINKPNDWDSTLVGFKIDLGDKTLADFKEVTVDFMGSSGDFGYKRVQILAGKIDAVQAEGGLPSTGGFNDADNATTHYFINNKALNGAGSARTNQTEGAGMTAAQKITLEIDPTTFAGRLEGIDEESELEIAFHIQAQATEYSIANITFVLKD